MSWLLKCTIKSNTFYAADGITAIKHGNGRDWWVSKTTRTCK